LQDKFRHQATKQKVSDAFKAPIFQQRSKQLVEKTHSQSDTGSQRVVASSQNAQMELIRLREEEEHMALQVQQENQQVIQDKEEEEEGRTLVKELAKMEECIHRLCREDQWLMAECRSVEQEEEGARARLEAKAAASVQTPSLWWS